MTEWQGTIKGTEDTYPHLSSVRYRFKENDDIIHAAICDAALSLISDQALEIHRLRESMRVLSYLDPSIKNYVDNPWGVAQQVRVHVMGRIDELEKALQGMIDMSLGVAEYDDITMIRQARKVLENA